VDDLLLLVAEAATIKGNSRNTQRRTNMIKVMFSILLGSDYIIVFLLVGMYLSLERRSLLCCVVL